MTMGVKTGWVVGCAILALLIILSYTYFGNGKPTVNIPVQMQG
jgi:hypothetical protein